MPMLSRLVLLALVLSFTAGFTHCQHGDQVALGWRACISNVTWGPDGIRWPVPTPVVNARWSASGLAPPSETVLEVDACGASLMRVVDGEAQRFVARVEPDEIARLHFTLADAGAGDLVGYADCGAITGHGNDTQITFYEPIAQGRALSNSFAFGNCAVEPRADEVARILKNWVDEHFAQNVF